MNVGGNKVSVNTAGEGQGSKLSDLGAGGDRGSQVVERGPQGEEVKLSTSGANATPPESKKAPTVDQREVGTGPNVDPKTNAYHKSLYHQVVKHNSTGGETKLIREDR